MKRESNKQIFLTSIFFLYVELKFIWTFFWCRIRTWHIILSSSYCQSVGKEKKSKLGLVRKGLNSLSDLGDMHTDITSLYALHFSLLFRRLKGMFSRSPWPLPVEVQLAPSFQKVWYGSCYILTSIYNRRVHWYGKEIKSAHGNFKNRATIPDIIESVEAKIIITCHWQVCHLGSVSLFSIITVVTDIRNIFPAWAWWVVRTWETRMMSFCSQ